MLSSAPDNGEAGSDRQTELPLEAVSYKASSEPPNDPSLDIQERNTAEKTIVGNANEAALNFKPGWRFIIAFTSLSAITLMVALDATSLGNALPVRNTSQTLFPKKTDRTLSENCRIAPWHRDSGILGWDVLPSGIHRSSAHRRFFESHLRSQTTRFDFGIFLCGWHHHR